MNRFICYLGIVFLGLSLSYSEISAQKLTISWEAPRKIYSDGKEKISLSFLDASFHPKFHGLPTFTISLYNQSISNFTIRQPIFKEVSEVEKQLLVNESLSDSIVTDIEIAYQYKKPVSIVQIIPIRYNQQKKIYEKLVSFSYTYTSLPKVIKPAITKSNSNARIASYSNNSVLAAGDWYKLQISSTATSTGSGLYKIDYPLLVSMGIDPSKVDPKKIALYGNGGGMLPEVNNAFKYDDLQENAIYVEGEADGKFDQGDYILFYGQGPDVWKYDSVNQSYSHIKNIYSDQAFYFLTVKQDAAKRISDVPSLPASGTTITSYTAHQFFEEDKINLLKSGRQWYGDKFDAELTKTYKFSTAGAVAGSNVTVKCALMAASPTPSSFQISHQGQVVEIYNVPQSNSDYGKKAFGAVTKFSIPLSNPLPADLELTVTYKKLAPTSVGYLNYFEIESNSNLELIGNQLEFDVNVNQGISALHIAKATAGTKVWDITDPVNAKNQLFQFDNEMVKFGVNTDLRKKFIGISGNNFAKPIYKGKVTNQNLHSLAFQNIPDLVIITPPLFEAQAKRLADFRQSHDNLKAAVVNTSQIYNEFSSGAQDLVAMRNFMKMLYDNGTSGDSIRYLLLFGAASYDYKDRIINNNNLVPIYETLKSLDDIGSQSSDDYCGFLDDNEGSLVIYDDNNEDDPIPLFPTHTLDIGIGRLPVRNEEEANKVVDKLINYNNSLNALGKWRNRLTLVADNAENNLESYKEGGEDMEMVYQPMAPVINTTKLYLDGFPLISSPAGQESPAIKETLLKDIDKGTLLVNFYGHGSESIWAQENILNISEINTLKNYNYLPFFVTATCSFGRYDSPADFSGAQSLVLNPAGGGVGILTSTRAVFAGSNAALNRSFYRFVFNFSNNRKPTLGDVIRNTKNAGSNTDSNWNYALLGDPSMTLAYPQHNIVITGFNNKSINELDTISALSQVSLNGEIRDNGKLIPEFNGTVYLTIYDKESRITISPSARWATPISYNSMTNIIFDGTASVKDGKFSINFIVPKDISYKYGIGKISMYASDTSTNTDAGGYYNKIVIGGSNPDAMTDNTPPKIQLFMNDESFQNGGVTGSEPVFLAKLYDENGINISSTGIGHEITGIFNNSKEVIVMNEYYSAEKDDYKNGQVKYPLSQLAPGTYTIRFKAWDTNNNSSESSITFVVKDKELYISKPYNVPNPFITNTAFEFDHNRAGEDLEVDVDIYSITGQHITRLADRLNASSTHVSLNWDGRDNYGNVLSPALYIYQLRVKSLKDMAETTQHSKLIIEN